MTIDRLPPHPFGYAVSSERGGQQEGASAELEQHAGVGSSSRSSSLAMPDGFNRPRLPSIPSLLNTPIHSTATSPPSAEFPLPPSQVGGVQQPPLSSLDANLRQLALLQALVARQQALVETTTTVQQGHPSSTNAYDSHPHHERHLASAPISPVENSFSHSLMANDWSNVVEGLNSSTGTSTDVSAQGTPNPSQGMGGAGEWPPSGVTANELAVAQQQLDMWSQTVFTSDSPVHTQPSTPAVGNGPSSPPSHTSHLLQQHPHTQAPFDWSSLYSSQTPQHHPSGYPSLPPISTNYIPPSPAPQHQPYRSNGLPRPISDESDSPPPSASGSGSNSAQTRSRRTSASGGGAGRGRNGAGGSGAVASAAGTGMTTRGGGRRGASRGVRYAEVEEEDLEDKMEFAGFGEDEDDPGPLQNGTPEEIEEDKRRRNTAASARFRAKKKQRDQQLQQTSVQLREKVQDLEKEKGSLKAENQWLRDLVSERAEISPKIRELLISQPR